jgi:hypothetical protein
MLSLKDQLSADGVSDKAHAKSYQPVLFSLMYIVESQKL